MTTIVLAFFAGLFVLNGLPHLVRGITGKRHMTPFHRDSSAILNVIWAWINLIIGGLLTAACGDRAWSAPFWAAFVTGGAVVSVYLAAFWSNPDARLPWHRPR